MPSIRDLVAAIRQREGVEAAVVLGRDGLLIDGQAVPGLDAEGISPPVSRRSSAAADELGAASQSRRTAHRRPRASRRAGHRLASLIADAMLLVLAHTAARTSASCCSSFAATANTSPRWSER